MAGLGFCAAGATCRLAMTWLRCTAGFKGADVLAGHCFRQRQDRVVCLVVAGFTIAEVAPSFRVVCERVGATDACRLGDFTVSRFTSAAGFTPAAIAAFAAAADSAGCRAAPSKSGFTIICRS